MKRLVKVLWTFQVLMVVAWFFGVPATRGVFFLPTVVWLLIALPLIGGTALWLADNRWNVIEKQALARAQQARQPVPAREHSTTRPVPTVTHTSTIPAVPVAPAVIKPTPVSELSNGVFVGAIIKLNATTMIRVTSVKEGGDGLMVPATYERVTANA